MELLAIIGLIAIIAIIFTGGGIFGWGLKALGTVVSFLAQGWSSCISAIIWLFILFFVFGMILAMLGLI